MCESITITLHYNPVQMTRNHMALSIDNNDDLKEDQQLQLQSQFQLQSHYNHNHINVHKHQPYVNGIVR